MLFKIFILVNIRSPEFLKILDTEHLTLDRSKKHNSFEMDKRTEANTASQRVFIRADSANSAEYKSADMNN